MNILNPFDKESKKDMDFIDRSAIAVLFIFFVGLTLYLFVKLFSLFRVNK
jgi:hypothetical protein